jgi:hypothetical protein
MALISSRSLSIIVMNNLKKMGAEHWNRAHNRHFIFLFNVCETYDSYGQADKKHPQLQILIFQKLFIIIQ